MNAITGLSIAFCTRNRPVELKGAIHSVLRALPEINVPVQILIVDDGELGAFYLTQLEQLTIEEGAAFSYVNKRDQAGLLRSRVETLRHVQYDLVLYLDDDVELEPGFLKGLIETYTAHPNATGVGGVDLLTEKAPRWRRWYELAVGFRSTRLGRLSISGFGGGMDQWKFQSQLFPTDYLYGCNMSFRKEALANLTAPAWFGGYSLGEDLYVSYIARSKGPLLVQPSMRVRHFQSPVARDKLELVSYTLIVNHYRLLNVMRAPLRRYVSFSITVGGLLLMFSIKAVLDALRLRPNFSKVRGAIRGIHAVISSAFRERAISKVAP